MWPRCRQGFYHLGMLLNLHTHLTNHSDVSESLCSIWYLCFNSTKVKENREKNYDSSPASFNNIRSSPVNLREDTLLLFPRFLIILRLGDVERPD